MELLTLVEPKKDYGFYCWTPHDSKVVKDFCHVTVDDVIGGISSGPDVRPPQMLARVPTPQQFKELPALNFLNKFPNNPGYMVPLFVAMQRGLKLSDVDFVLGGSALEVLGNKLIDRGGDQPSSPTRYLVQKVRNVIVVCKSKEYVQNRADFGHQFEKMCTGVSTGGFREDDGSIYEHMHVMHVGGVRILFCAEVDAVDADGHCVECKSGNPRYFGTKVMWQMVSSGARMLAQGEKQRGNILAGVRMRSLREMVSEHSRVLKQMQESIVECLQQIQESSLVGEDKAVELDFLGGKLVFKPCHECCPDMLPSIEVVDQLIEFAETSATSDA